LVLATGYFRVTQFGKGWDFYAHEPVFWFKMLLFSVMGASSLFPTIKIIQRAIEAKEFSEGKRAAPLPLSEKLAARMVLSCATLHHSALNWLRARNIISSI